MVLTLNKRQLNIDLSSALATILIFAWSVYYYYSTFTETEEGPESVLFIRPIFFGLVICFPFVLKSTISIKQKVDETAKEASGEEENDRGFLEKSRLILTATSAVYCIALPFAGYLIPSVLYVIISCYLLGSRKFWMLVALSVGLSGVLSLIFRTLLSVPIPIWPVWFG